MGVQGRQNLLDLSSSAYHLALDGGLKSLEAGRLHSEVPWNFPNNLVAALQQYTYGPPKRQRRRIDPGLPALEMEQKPPDICQ